MNEKRTKHYLVQLETDDLTGEISREMWFDPETEMADRPNGPADIEFYVWHGRACRSETYYKQGVIARTDDLPSIVVVDVETGVETLRRWSRDGMTTRLGGEPAIIKTDLETGTVVMEEYWENGVRHRDHGPATIERHPKTGRIIDETYWFRGERTQGPPSRNPEPG